MVNDPSGLMYVSQPSLSSQSLSDRGHRLVISPLKLTLLKAWYSYFPGTVSDITRPVRTLLSLSIISLRASR